MYVQLKICVSLNWKESGIKATEQIWLLNKH